MASNRLRRGLELEFEKVTAPSCHLGDDLGRRITGSNDVPLSMVGRLAARAEQRHRRHVPDHRLHTALVDQALQRRHPHREQIVGLVAAGPAGADPTGPSSAIGLMTLEHPSRLLSGRRVVTTQLLVLLESPPPDGTSRRYGQLSHGRGAGGPIAADTQQSFPQALTQSITPLHRGSSGERRHSPAKPAT